MLRYSMASLLGLMALAGITLAALLNPNRYFAAGFQGAIFLCIFSSIYMAIFCRGSRQRIAGGFAVFVISFQVWPAMFGDSVYLNDLAVSAAIHSHIPSNAQSMQFDGWTSYPPISSMRMPSNPNISPYYIPPPQVVGGQGVQSNAGVQGQLIVYFDSRSLQIIVSSLTSLIVGLLGMLVAVIVDRLKKKQRAVRETPTEGEASWTPSHE